MISGEQATRGTVLHIGEKTAERSTENFSAVRGREKSGRAAALAGPPVILLVEDNPADVFLLREALASHDVLPRLYVAHDGEEGIHSIDAIDEARMPCPDLIVVDINLPRKNGFEVLARVRSSRRCRDKPVVILSSSTAAPDRDKANRLGASSYIRKPSSLKEFLAIGGRLKSLLARS